MTDTEIINDLGGPTKVAVLLGMDKPGSVQRVQNWLKRGIPAQVKVDYPYLFLNRPASADQPQPDRRVKNIEAAGIDGLQL